MKLLHVIFLCAVLSICHGYRILGLFPYHGKSHFVMFEQLMKGLAKRGHRVDVVSTFPLKKPYPNYTDLVALPVSRSFMNNITYAESKCFFAGSATYATATIAGNNVCEHLANPKIQELVRNPPNDPPYDLVIVECHRRVGTTSVHAGGASGIPLLLLYRNDGLLLSNTQYVIRNKPNSLRSPDMDMPWWKLNLIDVFLFSIASLILSVYLLWGLVTILFKNFSKNSTRSEKKLKRIE